MTASGDYGASRPKKRPQANSRIPREKGGSRHSEIDASLKRATVNLLWLGPTIAKR